MSFKTLNDIDVAGKTVLLRADLNVPTEGAVVTDTTRIDRVKPTIDKLVAARTKVVVMAHFGRPKGERNPDYSLSFLPPILTRQWGVDVAFCDECIGEGVRKAIDKMSDGDVMLLENVRFHKGEEKNDPDFIRELAKLGDVYVNDAFSAAHRAHASTEGLAHLLPTAAGLLMQEELSALQNALENPKKPVVAIVGGAKISSKLSVLNNLVKKVDYLVLGGGMANTFHFAQGIDVGKSLCEKDMADEARAIMAAADEAGCRIILPADRIVVREFGENAPHETIAANAIGADQESVDIGPQTVREIEEILDQAKTVLWNGPMGVFEVKPFDNGTNALARAVASRTQKNALLSVAGGGDTVAALENAGVVDQFSYVSTAGGAFLEWLEGKTLPGVAALLSVDKAA